MLFAHIADTHLGYRQFNLEEREKDFYSAFHQAVDRMLREGVELVIHAGDLFDEPRPSIRALVEAKKGIEKLRRKGVRIVMIPGNHDIVMRRGSMAPHALFDGVDVLTLEKPSLVVDDLYIAGLPYLPRSYRDVLGEGVSRLEAEAKEYKRSILVLHQGIDRFLPYEHELEIGQLQGGFAYYALGHVHARIEEAAGKSMICYSGSTEIWRAEEASDWERNGKGFLLVDTDRMKPERANLDVRPFLAAQVSDEEDILKLGERIEGYSSPVLTLTIKGGDDFSYLYEKLRNTFGEKALHILVRRQEEASAERLAAGGALNIRELLYEALEGFSKEEKDYSFEVFKHLARNDIETALALTEDFYTRWRLGDDT